MILFAQWNGLFTIQMEGVSTTKEHKMSIYIKLHDAGFAFIHLESLPISFSTKHYFLQLFSWSTLQMYEFSKCTSLLDQ